MKTICTACRDKVQFDRYWRRRPKAIYRHLKTRPPLEASKMREMVSGKRARPSRWREKGVGAPPTVLPAQVLRFERKGVGGDPPTRRDVAASVLIEVRMRDALAGGGWGGGLNAFRVEVMVKDFEISDKAWRREEEEEEKGQGGGELSLQKVFSLHSPVFVLAVADCLEMSRGSRSSAALGAETQSEIRSIRAQAQFTSRDVTAGAATSCWRLTSWRLRRRRWRRQRLSKLPEGQRRHQRAHLSHQRASSPEDLRSYANREAWRGRWRRERREGEKGNVTSLGHRDVTGIIFRWYSAVSRVS